MCINRSPGVTISLKTAARHPTRFLHRDQKSPYFSELPQLSLVIDIVESQIMKFKFNL